MRSLAARFTFLLVGFAPTFGCAGAARDPANASSAERSATGSGPTLDEERSRVLESLGKVDRRLARRLGQSPTGTQLLFPENRAPAELAGLFDFEARAHALSDARDRLTRGAAARPDAGWLPLQRLVAEESARLGIERDMPRGASSLVRAIALELPITDTNPDDVRGEDEGLASLLDRIKGTLAEGTLGPTQLAELDDALDSFEKRTASLAATPAAVARLRVAIAGARPRSTDSVPAWDSTRAAIEAFVGPLPADLDAQLERAHAPLRARIDPLVPKASAQKERLAEDAVRVLLGAGDCPEPAVREARAPGERRGMCGLLRSLANDDVAALLAADYAIDGARFALAIHAKRTDLAAAMSTAHTHVPLDTADSAHVFRFAFAHPIEAVTLGWAAALVASDPKTRAARLMAAGAPRPGDVTARIDK